LRARGEEDKERISVLLNLVAEGIDTKVRSSWARERDHVCNGRVVTVKKSEEGKVQSQISVKIQAEYERDWSM
jgi:hypothetical protein